VSCAHHAYPWRDGQAELIQLEDSVNNIFIIHHHLHSVCNDCVQMDVFNAAQKYMSTNTAVIILAGKEYGSGSSRDWAAKGPWMLVR